MFPFAITVKSDYSIYASVLQTKELKDITGWNRKENDKTDDIFNINTFASEHYIVIYLFIYLFVQEGYLSTVAHESSVTSLTSQLNLRLSPPHPTPTSPCKIHPHHRTPYVARKLQLCHTAKDSRVNDFHE